MDTRNLTCLNEGDSAFISSLHTMGRMRRRLLDLGLIEGTRVRCTQKSPCGDPVAYSVRGAVIAIRNEDARKIFVK